MPAEQAGSTSHDAQLSVVLSEFARTMATDFPIQAILDHLIERIVEMLPVSGPGVTLISTGKTPQYIAASDPTALLFEQLQTELDEGPCLLAYTTGEAVEVPNHLDESRFSLLRPPALWPTACAPCSPSRLRHNDRQLGALDLYRDSPGPLTQQELATGRTLADGYLINAEARNELKNTLERSRHQSLNDNLTGLAQPHADAPPAASECFAGVGFVVQSLGRGVLARRIST